MSYLKLAVTLNIVSVEVNIDTFFFGTCVTRAANSSKSKDRSCLNKTNSSKYKDHGRDGNLKPFRVRFSCEQ